MGKGSGDGPGEAEEFDSQGSSEITSAGGRCGSEWGCSQLKVPGRCNGPRQAGRSKTACAQDYKTRHMGPWA